MSELVGVRIAITRLFKGLKFNNTDTLSAAPYLLLLLNTLILQFCFTDVGGPGSSVGIATELRAGRSGDRISVGGGEIFRTCPDRPWGPPSLLYNGYRVFPGGKERPGRNADPSAPSSAVVMKG